MSNLFRVALLASWVVLVAMLVRGRDAVPQPIVPVDFAGAPAPEGSWEGWMGIYMQGRKIGYSHHRMSPAGEGFRIEDRSVLRMRVMDSDQTIYAGASARTGADYSLRDFAVSLRSEAAKLKIEGKVVESSVILEMDSGGEISMQQIPLSGPLYLPSAARAELAAQLRPGARLAVNVFDPSAMGSDEMVVEVVGREPLQVGDEARQVWKVRESFRGIVSEVWLDDEGRSLREQGPLGMVAVREPAEKAMHAGWDEGAPVDLMNAVAIPVHPPLEAARDLETLRVHLSGLGTLVAPLDARQSLADDVLTIQREATDGRSTYTLPNSEARFADARSATPFLQVDHPRVREQSAAILGDENDARRAAKALRRWVFDNLEKRAVVSIPNALQVLEMGAGDCNEHAVLFAALARAAGLPARVVAGIVYADGVFLYHAWDEVWLGDGWVSVDAAFDQMPVDATHIKLIEGGPDTHVGLVPVIGQLSVDIVATTPTRG